MLSIRLPFRAHLLIYPCEYRAFALSVTHGYITLNVPYFRAEVRA